MSYLTEHALSEMGFKYLGKNVKISSKASIYCPALISIDDNSRIDDFCVIKGPLTIGKFVHISLFCVVSASREEICFEDFSGLSHGVSVFSATDDYSGMALTNPTVPDDFKKVKHAPVTLQKHSIVGAHSIIMPGVTVTTGCAIGAMSFVTKSTLPWGVYFGSPAKRIKERRKDLLVKEQEFLDSLKE